MDKRRRSSAPRPAAPSVASITTARRPLSEDVDQRASRYLLSMGIRTACVVLAVVFPEPLRWVFIAGAIVLPYVAVVIANAGRERARAPETLLDPRAISAGPAMPGLPPTGAPPPRAERPRTEWPPTERPPTQRERSADP